MPMDQLVLNEAAGKQMLWLNPVVSDASSDERRHRGVRLFSIAAIMRHTVAANHVNTSTVNRTRHTGTQWVLLCR